VRYLTRSGGSLVFQIRIPRSLERGWKLSPVRLNLGSMPADEARRYADALAGAARLAFERWRTRMTEDTPPATVRADVQKHVASVITMLRALDAVDGSSVPNDILAPALDGVITQAVAIDRERRVGGPRSDPRFDHAAPYLAVLRDENAARAFIGLGPNPGLLDAARSQTRQTSLLSDTASFAETVAGHLRPMVQAQIGDLVPLLSDPDAFARSVASALGPVIGVAPRRATMRFSEAVEMKLQEEGAGYKSAKTLRRKARVFLALSEDRPVAEITREQLKKFVEDLVWLEPSSSRGRSLDAEQIRALVAENKARKGETMGEKTVADYLNWARIVIRFGCAAAHVPYVLEDVEIKMPAVAKPAEERGAPDFESLDGVFRFGLSRGVLSDALLGPLGLLTGRRIGLLAFMQRENISRRNGVWLVKPSRVVVREDGTEMEVPFKTKESMSAYVLHDFFAECGFIDWAKRADGPVFRFLMQAQDPADAAQKRMKRVYSGSGADPAQSGTFHWLRHGNIHKARDQDVDENAIRGQVGHARTKDPHSGYAPGLTPNQLMTFASSPLPPEVDWSMFMGVDWEALATRRPTGGRKKKSG